MHKAEARRIARLSRSRSATRSNLVSNGAGELPLIVSRWLRRPISSLLRCFDATARHAAPNGGTAR